MRLGSDLHYLLKFPKSGSLTPFVKTLGSDLHYLLKFPKSGSLTPLGRTKV
jgi:hypothetical protein